MIKACAKPNIGAKRVKMTLYKIFFWKILMFFGQNRIFEMI